MTELLAVRAPLLAWGIGCPARFGYDPVAGMTAECGRVGDRERDCLGESRRHGMNIQVVTGAAGELTWYSPELLGRTVDITAARLCHIAVGVRAAGASGPG
ncbi:hypothetical protein ME763_37450 (plasmid) [Streptomyces murinus]|uniref:hypothetical protein n=1 Tax=Streptomyces murinus TaxID=33900 RepID=UPI00117F93B3|nr:hypothetical protein [Streptomyces murinus]WDO11216.1 hypothetical protein ME763_37450 [Streptomyces murinus]